MNGGEYYVLRKATEFQFPSLLKVFDAEYFINSRHIHFCLGPEISCMERMLCICSITHFIYWVPRSSQHEREGISYS